MNANDTPNDALLTSLKEAAAEAARIARNVPDGALARPTPCADWDLRALLNHWIRYTAHGLEHRARRQQLPEELVERDFTAAPDWAEAYAAQLDRAVAAWSEPAAWQGEIDLGFLSMAAPDVAAMLVKELAVHGWDVARATGQEFHCSPGLAALVLEVVEKHGEMYRRYDGFAAPLPPPDDASTFARALALSGRDPVR